MSDVIWAALISTVGVAVASIVPYVVQERRRKSDLRERHREERQAAYASLLDAAFASQQALGDVGLAVADWRQRVEAAQRTLVEAKNVVDIVGADAVRDAADAVLAVLVQISNDGVASYERFRTKLMANLTGRTQGGFAAASAIHIDSFGDARRVLIRTIRADVGFEQEPGQAGR